MSVIDLPCPQWLRRAARRHHTVGMKRERLRPRIASQCEAEVFAVRGGKGRTARRKRPHCEAERPHCEAEKVALRSARSRTAKRRTSQCELGVTQCGRTSNRTAWRGGRKALSQSDPAASHCGRAVRRECFAVRPAWVGATAWVGARTLPMHIDLNTATLLAYYRRTSRI